MNIIPISICVGTVSKEPGYTFIINTLSAADQLHIVVHVPHCHGRQPSLRKAGGGGHR